MDAVAKELQKMIAESTETHHHRKRLPDNHLTGREFDHPTGGIITQIWCSPRAVDNFGGGWLTTLYFHDEEIASRILPD